MDTSDYQAEAEIAGDSAEDTQLLQAMAREVRRYIGSFKWSSPIKSLHFAGGVGGIFGLFLVELTDPVSTGDTSLWVIIGDIPSAYLVVDTCPVDTIHTYCNLMDVWADAVLAGTTGAQLFPVPAAPTHENARQLKIRMRFIRKEIIPLFQH